MNGTKLVALEVMMLVQSVIYLKGKVTCAIFSHFLLMEKNERVTLQVDLNYKG